MWPHANNKVIYIYYESKPDWGGATIGITHYVVYSLKCILIAAWNLWKQFVHTKESNGHQFQVHNKLMSSVYELIF